jgi:hypothetical protein
MTSNLIPILRFRSRTPTSPSVYTVIGVAPATD